MTDFELRFRQRAGSFTLTLDHAWTAPVTGIFGPSGSGKSTLLEVLLGLCTAASVEGVATIDHVCLFNSKANHALPVHTRAIGWVPQEAALFPHIPVAANISFARPRHMPVDQQRLLQIATLCGVAKLSDRRPADLSGGERQRVALARGLYGAQRLLLMDEPFASIDLKGRRQLLRALKDYALTAGLALVYVSHDWTEIEMLCDYALILNEGQVLAAGTPAELSPFQ